MRNIPAPEKSNTPSVAKRQRKNSHLSAKDCLLRDSIRVEIESRRADFWTAETVTEESGKLAHALGLDAKIVKKSFYNRLNFINRKIITELVNCECTDFNSPLIYTISEKIKVGSANVALCLIDNMNKIMRKIEEKRRQ